MGNIAFKELNLDTNVNYEEINIGDIKLQIRDYLNVSEKARMIQFIVDGALDDNTGCFSPLRVNVYFDIGLCVWYAGIVFDENDIVNIEKVYDILTSNGVIQRITNAIPEDEFELIKDLAQETIDDIAKYNSSAAGIIRNMTVDADGLGNQIEGLLDKIKNAEGLETLSVIKDVV